MMDSIPPQRRAMFTPAIPARAAEILSSYMKQGIGGFTFSNQTLTTPDAIGLAGELKQLLS